jgi:hypothetical protein
MTLQRWVCGFLRGIMQVINKHCGGQRRPPVVYEQTGWVLPVHADHVPSDTANSLQSRGTGSILGIVCGSYINVLFITVQWKSKDHPLIRLDYILLSPSIVDHAAKASRVDEESKLNQTSPELSTCFSNPTQIQPIRNFIKRHPMVVMDDPLIPPIDRLREAATNVTTNSQQWKAVNNHPNVYAGVEITDETSILSDHYPVFAAWRTVDPVTLF